MNSRKVDVARVFSIVKPWILFFGVLIILRVTGLFSAVSSASQYVLLQTGVMDATPVEIPGNKTFNYDFSLSDIDKNPLAMESLKGKVIFINVWATWCGPCRAEMPSIQRLYESVDREKVAFVMLSVDKDDAHTKVKKFLASKEYTFPAYFPSGKLPEMLKVRSIPATFVVNKEGKVVFREMGAANYDTEEFRKFIEGLY
jgi:thiol-disulfide isomerase/thioredoxin